MIPKLGIFLIVAGLIWPFGPSVILTAPQLLPPADKSVTTSTNPSFTWSPVENARNYDFRLTGFDMKVVKPPYTIKTSLTPGKYLWKVRARAWGAKIRPWSETYSFTVKKEPPVYVSPGGASPTPDLPAPPSATPPTSVEPPPPVLPPAPVGFFENFSSYPLDTCFPDLTVFGPWLSQFNGYGCNKIEHDPSNSPNKLLSMAPLASQSSSETHAGLVLLAPPERGGPSFTGPLPFQADLYTVSQLRATLPSPEAAPPNPWEVAWVFWNYTDNDHFYYFIPKPNGWELGKKDPDYPGGQRFLATGSAPTFPIARWYTVKVIHDSANTISVYVNNALLTTFTDTERPYTAGKLGLYTEDAKVYFDNVSVTQP